jgi:hypothetical protein
MHIFLEEESKLVRSFLCYGTKSLKTYPNVRRSLCFYNYCISYEVECSNIAASILWNSIPIFIKTLNSEADTVVSSLWKQ